MEELKEYEMIFDDREFDNFYTQEEESIEIDEEFEKQVSEEFDEYLKEHPLHFED